MSQQLDFMLSPLKNHRKYEKIAVMEQEIVIFRIQQPITYVMMMFDKIFLLRQKWILFGDLPDAL